MKFNETQKFQQIWIWAIISIAAVWVVYSLKNRLIGDERFIGYFALTFYAVLIWFFYSLKLITEVREDGLYVRFFPLHLKYHKIEYKKATAVTYRPIMDYGGWGIKWGRKGKAYNVSGKRGVMLELKNGKNLLIGSQRADELAEALRHK